MSVDEDTVKTGSPQASSTSSLQLSERAGSYGAMSVMMEGTAATPDLAAACPVPGTAASPKHTSTSDAAVARPEGDGQRARGSEGTISRRNSSYHSKQQQQQQQQQMRVAKRRNTASSGFKHPTSGKRRRRANSESDSVLPTNFLLGGNIFDPLNLNSLMDEEVNKALNAETPKSSPLPAKSRDPVEILIPRDITDPLNLNSGIADSGFLVPPYKSSGRKRHRNRHHGGSGGGGGGSGISNTQISLSESGKSEVKTGPATPLPGMLSKCSAQDVSKDSDSFPSVTGNSHEHSANNSSSSKEEMTSVSMEDSTSSISGCGSQHTSRRKRRRNSGKMELPLTHSTPVGKSASGERGSGTKHSQSFHTPRSGSRPGPGGRQHQQPRDQQKKKFQYGNYNKYYGYRNPSASEDPRVRIFRPEWFKGKQVLDLGCNSGHLTLYIAKMMRPARILGLDIDSGLVHAARKNIRHYLSEVQTQEARRATQGKKDAKPEQSNGNESQPDGGEKQGSAESRDENGAPAKGGSDPAAGNDDDSSRADETQKQDVKMEETEQQEEQPQEDGGGGGSPPTTNDSVSCSFPLSLRISRGPIAAPPLTETATTRPGEFPSNVSFVKANYVLESDHLLVTQRPEYDVILCMSVTKWVHLNWGDSGLKRLFKRVYRHLRPGGLFILEPQPWESYVRRKKLTDNISRNYHSIRLKPDQFSTYLTNEVGFASFEHLGTPKCSIRGFQRPIYLFHK